MLYIGNSIARNKRKNTFNASEIEGKKRGKDKIKGLKVLVVYVLYISNSFARNKRNNCSTPERLTGIKEERMRLRG